MSMALLIAAVVIFACVLLNKVANKIGMPILLAFILLGMFFGSDGAVKIAFDDYGFAEQICSIALVFIMFYGGFGTNWNEARRVALPAGLLSSLGVVLTALLTGVFCHFALGTDWLEGMLIGSVIGSTDAASVFSILRSRKLALKYGTSSLLEVESGSNDPLAYTLTMVFILAINGTAGAGSVAYLAFSQLVYGAGIGAAIACLSVALMKRVKLASPGLDGAMVIAIALLSYAAPSLVGGNGYLSAYIVGIALGNADIRHKKTLVPFFDSLTGLMQMLIFFLLGLLAFPSRLPRVALPALAVALFVTFAARPAAVFAIMAPFRARLNQKLLISWSGLRGAASIVFAIMAAMNAPVANDLFHMVFFIVLFSILLQGSLLPLVSKKLSMIDKNADVMKTFSDYTGEVQVQLMSISITADNEWCSREVRSITLPPDTLFALIKRGGKDIVPRGDTVLMDSDIVTICSRTPDEMSGIMLTEQRVKKGDPIAGRRIADTGLGADALVLMILRGRDTIVPNGETVIAADDVLVINRTEKERSYLARSPKRRRRR